MSCESLRPSLDFFSLSKLLIFVFFFLYLCLFLLVFVLLQITTSMSWESLRPSLTVRVSEKLFTGLQEFENAEKYSNFLHIVNCFF